jgi:hypothetical protein
MTHLPQPAIRRGCPPRARWLAGTLIAGAILWFLPPSSAHAHILGGAAARAAAQATADSYAGGQTSLVFFYHASLHSFDAHAEWTRVDPEGCKNCGWDEDGFFDRPLTVHHKIKLSVTCVGPHTSANRDLPCATQAFVTEVLGPIRSTSTQFRSTPS